MEGGDVHPIGCRRSFGSFQTCHPAYLWEASGTGPLEEIPFPADRLTVHHHLKSFSEGDSPMPLGTRPETSRALRRPQAGPTAAARGVPANVQAEAVRS